MTQRRSFRRKIAYVTAIALLLFPLTMLSRPSAGGSEQAHRQEGGKLPRLRAQYGLSQANLGEIDPASETMKLATLGMRGIAANLLWEKANHYKKTEDWTNFAATLEQITKLQPNFISVWQYQGWNLSYNLSVEFDDYRDRYMYVIRGINFLQEGERVNRDEPRLLWDIGWFISHKIGRADERKLYRRLFKEDDDFHDESGRTRDQRDNWLVGKEWFDRAVEAVDFKDKRLRGKSPLIFYNNGPMAVINYADALQGDGVHGDRARIAWKRAADEWSNFANRNILTSYGFRIVLNSMERKQEEARRYQQELDRLVEGAREQVQAQKFHALSDEEKAIWETPVEKLSLEQLSHLGDVQQKMKVAHEEVAEYVRSQRPDLSRQASGLARRAAEAEFRAQVIDNYRHQVNYDYWTTRCEFEQSADALAARELIYLGDKALREQAALVKAKDLYEQGMLRWQKAFERYPRIADEGTLAEDLVDTVLDYHRLLQEMGEKIPDDFVLKDLVLAWDRDKKLKGVFQDAEEQTGPGPQPDAKTPQPSSEATEPSAAEPPDDEPAPDQSPSGAPNDEPQQAADPSKEQADVPEEPADEESSAAEKRR